MDLKDAAEHSRKAAETARAALATRWEKTLDEDGSFEHTFGDPLLTPYAITIWVGYDENGDTKIDLVYPVTEEVPFGVEEGYSEYELSTLENLAEESVELLDGKVYEFVHVLSNYIMSLDNHDSLADPLRDAYISAKTKAASAAEQYKKAAEAEKKEAAELQVLESEYRGRMPKMGFKEKREVLKQLQAEKERLAILHAAVQRMRDENNRRAQQREQEERARQRRLVLARAQSEQEASIKAQKARNDLTEFLISRDPDALQIMRDAPTDEWAFFEYVSVVRQLNSPYILWQHAQLHVVPPLFRHFSFVTEINLSNNAIILLPHEIFTMPNLQRLYLGFNKIRRLPPLAGCPTLQVLDLQQNQLTELPKDLGALTLLRTLDLERNKIRALNGAAIASLTSLDFLNLAYNAIKIVPMELGQLQKLMYLNLRSNPVVNLPPDIYIQGTAASLEFLRNITNVGDTHISSLITDISRLLKGEKRDHLSSHPPHFLCDLVLKASPTTDFKYSLDVEEAPQLHAYDEEADRIFHPVHRALVTARCPTLHELIRNIATSETKLEIDASTQAPILPIDLTPKQLSALVRYIYTDQYIAPELKLLEIASSCSEDERNQLVANNEKLTKKWFSAVDHAREVATKYELSYLDAIISKHLKISSNAESTFTQDLKALWMSATEESCDVVFYFPQAPEIPPIYAHKAILCARSDYFNTLLTGGMIESQNKRIEVSDEPGVFSSIIEFCYLDDVEELDGDTVITLLAQATLYGLTRLANIVANVVGYSLDYENVTGILASSILYSIKPLAHACYFFILSNTHAVKRTQGWKELDHELRAKILKRAEKWGVPI